MIKRKKENLKYKVFPVRLNAETIENLKSERIKSGLSWNLFICKLFNAYYAKEYGFNKIPNSKKNNNNKRKTISDERISRQTERRQKRLPTIKTSKAWNDVQIYDHQPNETILSRM